jgi:hypothetical protein
LPGELPNLTSALLQIQPTAGTPALSGAQPPKLPDVPLQSGCYREPEAVHLNTPDNWQPVTPQSPEIRHDRPGLPDADSACQQSVDKWLSGEA